VLRGKTRAINAYIQKAETSEINNLMHLKQILEKQGKENLSKPVDRKK
jgi:hypothetical protein